MEAEILPSSRSISEIGKIRLESLTQDDQPIGIEYTSLMWDTRLSLWPARCYIMCIFFLVGMTQGYRSSIVLMLQERGASYSDQSLFVLAGLPYSAKMFTAPLIDLFYWKRAGKCRTWIFTSSLVIFIVLVSYLLFNGSEIHPSEVGRLTLIWTIINIAVVFFHITGEIWILKIFDDTTLKGQSAGISQLAKALGFFMGYNIFIPLNDVNWLNDHIYNQPVIGPMVSNTGFVLFMAIFSLALGIFTICFVAEKQIETDFGAGYVKLYIKLLPRLLTLKSMKNLLLCLVMTRFFYYLIMESLLLKLIDGGIKKTYIVNWQTIAYLFHIASIIVTTKLIKPGFIAKLNHMMFGYMAILLVFFLTIYLDLDQNGNLDRTKWLIVCLFMLEALFTKGLLTQAYMSIVAPADFSGAFLSMAFCTMNVSESVTNSLGLWIVDLNVVPYGVFAVVCCSMHLLAVGGSWRIAKKLDEYKYADFEINRYSN